MKRSVNDNFNTHFPFKSACSKYETKLRETECELDISREIMDDFREQYEMALEELYEIQSEVDELVNDCLKKNQEIVSLKSKFAKLDTKYRTQSQKLEAIAENFNSKERRKYQKRESYHKSVIKDQREEIKKLK